MPNCRFFFLPALLTVIALAEGLAASGVVPLPPVPWDKPDTAVEVTAGGVPIPVWAWAPGAGGVRYAHFDCDGPVEVRLRFTRPQDLVADKDAGRRLVSNDWRTILPEPVDPDRKTWRMTVKPGHNLFLPSMRLFICVTAREADEPRRGEPGVTSLEDLGILAGGEAPVTAALQKAIDRVSAGKAGAKGKVLLVPAGVYITGTLFMRDNVRLHLAPGAVLRGAEQAEQWRSRKGPLYGGTSAMIFFGSDVEADGKVQGIRNASITGRGIIDGWGSWFRRDTIDGVKGNNPGFYEGDLTNRARLIMAIGSQDCRIEGVTLRNPTFWTTHIVGCKAFAFRQVKVYSNHRINGDGLNFDSSDGGSIEACVMITGDDSHCLKNEGIAGILAPNTNFRMTRSITAGFSKGVKFGWNFTKAIDCTYEDNWLVGGSFSIAIGRKYPAGVTPKIAEVKNLALRNMRIDGNLDIYLAGDLLDSYSMDNVLIEDCVVNGKLNLTNTTRLVIRRLTQGGTPVTSAAQLADQIRDCKDVVVE